LNLPAVIAAAAFCWLSAANSSCSARVIPYLAAMFSAEARFLQQVGCAAHGLHAAGDNHRRLVEQHRLRGECHRLQTGATSFVDRVTRHFLRQASLQGGDASRVETEARGQDVSEDDLVHLGGIQTSAPDHLTDDDRSQAGGGK